MPLVNQRLENALFDVKPFGSLLSLVQYGCSTLAKEDPPGIPILRMNNIQDDGWDLTSLKYIELDERELNTYKLLPEDILFNRTNSKELVGKCAVFREPGDWVFASYLVRVQTDQSRLLPQFASDFLGSSIGRLQVDCLSRQIIGMTNINAEEIRQLRLPLPSIAKQEGLVAAMDTARAERKAKVAEADALLAGISDHFNEFLGIAIADEEQRHFFAVKRRDVTDRSLSPSYYAPELRAYLKALRDHPATSERLSAYVDINPTLDLSGVPDDTLIGFIPMQSVSDGATGEYTVTDRPLREVRKGYTPFTDGDVLWAKITPCMQNGKSCIVEGLSNGIGFGSTEFHVLRVRSELQPKISSEFVREFLSNTELRRVAVYAFTGSAGQQRIPTTFLESLPFPALPIARQMEIVTSIKATREEAKRLLTEAESNWYSAKIWFENQLLG